MRSLPFAILLALCSTSLSAKPGQHNLEIFPKDLGLPNATLPGRPGIAQEAAAKPDGEATRIKKYRREWEAYNKLITLYLADHPRVIIFPVDPLEASAGEKEKKQHELLLRNMKIIRETITSPDAIKLIEKNIKLSVENAAKLYQAKQPAPSAAEVEAYREKVTEQYRQQMSNVFRSGMRDIATQIKFKDLNKLKMKFETSPDRKEEFEAIVAERKAFNFRATDQLYWQLVTEESGDKPVFPKGTAEEKKSMEKLWEIVNAARQAEIDRDDQLQREGK